ncbi:beta-lactamase family protein [Streptomyces sp. NBC_01017]|uniref:serine hydrolase domain-containing protein n=1 Tax=Streptomyces sp. NBC_01017 TaxID=2903721 RepID=UPI003863D4C6|nr:beta-lactamase family protein [Streptomyces sp. NBC_01017]WSV35042.1 beta-lactamase family protein [Streptomyces sp. NBC_01017]
MTVRTSRVVATLVATAALTLSAVVAVPASAAARAEKGTHDATRRAIAAAIEDGVPGVTATAKDRRGTWSTTTGVGNIRTDEPRSPHDRYRAGSITKTFVATVLLQLEAEDRLSLDDTVEKWLPGAVRGHGHDGRRVTVRQLLNHTSGIHNFTDDETYVQTYLLKDGFFEHRYDRLTPDQLVAISMSHEPDFAPGTSWNYSNTNYILAGMVIKSVTGRSFATEIRQRIIEPLHLTATSVPGNRVTMPQPSSRAYSKLAETTTGPTYDVTNWTPGLASSAGEMISSSADLNRFYTALLRGILLPAEQLKEMKTTVTVEAMPNAGYGLGLIDRKLSCGVHVWGHSGGVPGSISEAVTTADGRHSLAFNFNGDWSGDTDTVIEGEFCRN